MTRTKKSVSEWITCFGNCQQEQYGILSCDLAEDYWNGRLSDKEIIELLNSDCSSARRAASWAVSDRPCLNDASLELMRIASSELDFKIKGRAIRFVGKCPDLCIEDKREFLQRFMSDDDSRARELASSIIVTLDKRTGDDGPAR